MSRIERLTAFLAQLQADLSDHGSPDTAPDQLLAWARRLNTLAEMIEEDLL